MSRSAFRRRTFVSAADVTSVRAIQSVPADATMAEPGPVLVAVADAVIAVKRATTAAVDAVEATATAATAVTTAVAVSAARMEAEARLVVRVGLRCLAVVMHQGLRAPYHTLVPAALAPA